MLFDNFWLCIKVWENSYNSSNVFFFRNSYHGASPYLMNITSLGNWRFKVPHGAGALQTMNADPYRGPWGGANCRDSPVQVMPSQNVIGNHTHGQNKQTSATNVRTPSINAQYHLNADQCWSKVRHWSPGGGGGAKTPHRNLLALITIARNFSSMQWFLPGLIGIGHWSRKCWYVYCSQLHVHLHDLWAHL